MTYLSIIIVNWNTRDLLEKCLSSVDVELARLREFEVETLVVDNGSSDGSAGMVRQRFPWVKLIENVRNAGFAAGNNLALRQSTGTYILLLNPDTEIVEGGIVGLAKFLDAHAAAGAVGPALINPDGTLQPSVYPAPTLLREFWRLLHLDRISRFASYPLAEWRSEGPRGVEVVQGACLMLRARALRQVGQLDEEFFMYTEEVDLCLRLRKAGWNLYWLPHLRVVHHGGQSTKLASREMFLHLYSSKLRYFRKHYGSLAALGYKAILVLAAAARLVISPLAYLQGEPARSIRLELAANYANMLYRLPTM